MSNFMGSEVKKRLVQPRIRKIEGSSLVSVRFLGRSADSSKVHLVGSGDTSNTGGNRGGVRETRRTV